MTDAAYDYPAIDPKIIVVDRQDRQRTEINTNGLKESVAALREKNPATMGYINPIVVRRVGDTVILIAGERRLKAALELNLPLIPIRYWDTLDPVDAKIIEAEENVKREDLPWRDQVKAYGKIHALYLSKDPTWTLIQTASAVNLHHSYFGRIMHVYNALDSGKLDAATGIEQAYNIIARLSERKAESIVSEIIARGKQVFALTNDTVPNSDAAPDAAAATIEVALDDTVAADTSPSTNSSLPSVAAAIAAPPVGPILCADFHQWAATYSGRKFSLIHCDFPYGNYKGDDSQSAQNLTDSEDFYDNTEDIYWRLLATLTTNLDRLMSYSAHMMFWFNMNFYRETMTKLTEAGLYVHEHPLVWHKSDGRGVVPGNAVTHPRRTYDTAFLCVRGNRPFSNPGANSYAAPTVSRRIHPSEKPEPMLKVFLNMLVDETTTFFDPTAGSGAALRAAEDLGAASVFGLELDPEHAKAANIATIRARVLRSQGR